MKTRKRSTNHQVDSRFRVFNFIFSPYKIILKGNNAKTKNGLNSSIIIIVIKKIFGEFKLQIALINLNLDKFGFTFYVPFDFIGSYVLVIIYLHPSKLAFNFLISDG